MLLKTLRIAAVLVSNACFAQNVEHTLNHEIIDEIIANNSNCIVGCSADKIYLNPSRIVPTEEGVYLNINNDNYVLLSALNSNNQGCYVLVKSQGIDETSQCGNRTSQTGKWQCPYCYYWWEMGEECANEECPTNQWKSR